MTESDLKQSFEREKPVLLAWGKMVKDRLSQNIQRSIGARKLHEFLKIPAEPRVKDTDSFLEKALRRNKSYNNPLEDITDKVGVRFVVLLRSELKVVEKAIEACKLWHWQKDKDFEAEKVERPHHFDYQSIHYVVKATRPIKGSAGMIPAGTPCEIQVRTLLQHAYAELAHDRTYKPSGTIDHKIVRQVSRSAALVETTDEIFTDVNKSLLSANAEINRVHKLVAKAYLHYVGFNGSEDMRLSNALLDPYRMYLRAITRKSLNSFLSEHDFISEKVKQRAPLSVLYRHVSVLAVYMLLSLEPDVFPTKWPFDAKHLEFVYTDLGISTEGRL